MKASRFPLKKHLVRLLAFVGLLFGLFWVATRLGSGQRVDAASCLARAGAKHVLITIGTRPEAIKIASVYHALQKADGFSVEVWVSGQHPDMIASFLETFNISVTRTLFVMMKGQSLGSLTARAIGQFSEQFAGCQPDVLLVQGDTTTAYAAAVAAFYARIPVGHVEAGLRTYRVYSPFPEEFNRQSIGLVSSLHYAPTEISKENLVREGVSTSSITVTGNTVVDACLWAKKHLKAQKMRSRLAIDPTAKIVLLTAHRRENQINGGMHNIFSAVKRLVKSFDDLHFVFPVHPNPLVRKAVADSGMADVDRVHLLPPLPYAQNIDLISDCYLILTDSGGLQEEASAFNVPVFVMRDTSERMEGVYAGVAELVSSDETTIVEKVTEVMQDRTKYDRMSRSGVHPYGDGRAAERIVNSLRESLPREPPSRFEVAFKKDSQRWASQ